MTFVLLVMIDIISSIQTDSHVVLAMVDFGIQISLELAKASSYFHGNGLDDIDLRAGILSIVGVTWKVYDNIICDEPMISQLNGITCQTFLLWDFFKR